MKLEPTMLLTLVLVFSSCTSNTTVVNEEKITLPTDFVGGKLLVFDSIRTRRSIREYSDQPLTLRELSTLLFATQGETAPGKRAAPSAGALYPIESYVVVNDVKDLEQGLYHYLPDGHAINTVKKGDFADELSAMALFQTAVRDANVVFIWTAVPERTTGKYGERGIRYIYIEAGHISENLYL